MTDVELFTDGACRGNPGPGGWGVLLRAKGKERELCGGALSTTNNRMELTAAIEGLEALTRPCTAAVYTDSEYLRRGIGEWLPRWKAAGWRTAARKPVKNEDLWRRLEAAAGPHEISWHWVKGHSGHVENERADGLANRGLDETLAADRPTESAVK
ncbi:MAG: ribonuclease HI [Gammaproteobacteria bacterium]